MNVQFRKFVVSLSVHRLAERLSWRPEWQRTDGARLLLEAARDVRYEGLAAVSTPAVCDAAADTTRTTGFARAQRMATKPEHEVTATPSGEPRPDAHAEATQEQKTALQPQETIPGARETVQPQEAAPKPEETILKPQETTLEPQETTLGPQETTLEPQETTPESTIPPRMSLRFFQTTPKLETLVTNISHPIKFIFEPFDINPNKSDVKTIRFRDNLQNTIDNFIEQTTKTTIPVLKTTKNTTPRIKQDNIQTAPDEHRTNAMPKPELKSDYKTFSANLSKLHEITNSRRESKKLLVMKNVVKGSTDTETISSNFQTNNVMVTHKPELYLTTIKNIENRIQKNVIKLTTIAHEQRTEDTDYYVSKKLGNEIQNSSKQVTETAASNPREPLGNTDIDVRNDDMTLTNQDKTVELPSNAEVELTEQSRHLQSKRVSTILNLKVDVLPSKDNLNKVNNREEQSKTPYIINDKLPLSEAKLINFDEINQTSDFQLTTFTKTPSTPSNKVELIHFDEFNQLTFHKTPFILNELSSNTVELVHFDEINTEKQCKSYDLQQIQVISPANDMKQSTKLSEEQSKIFGSHLETFIGFRSVTADLINFDDEINVGQKQVVPTVHDKMDEVPFNIICTEQSQGFDIQQKQVIISNLGDPIQSNIDLERTAHEKIPLGSKQTSEVTTHSDPVPAIIKNKTFVRNIEKPDINDSSRSKKTQNAPCKVTGKAIKTKNKEWDQTNRNTTNCSSTLDDIHRNINPAHKNLLTVTETIHHNGFRCFHYTSIDSSGSQLKISYRTPQRNKSNQKKHPKRPTAAHATKAPRRTCSQDTPRQCTPNAIPWHVRLKSGLCMNGKGQKPAAKPEEPDEGTSGKFKAPVCKREDKPCGACMPKPCKPQPCNPCKPKPCDPQPCGPCKPNTPHPCEHKPCIPDSCKPKPCKPDPCKSKSNDLCDPCKPKPCKPEPCAPCKPDTCDPCKPKPCDPCTPKPCKPCKTNPCDPCKPKPCDPCKPKQRTPKPITPYLIGPACKPTPCRPDPYDPCVPCAPRDPCVYEPDSCKRSSRNRDRRDPCIALPIGPCVHKRKTCRPHDPQKDPCPADPCDPCDPCAPDPRQDDTNPCQSNTHKSSAQLDPCRSAIHQSSAPSHLCRKPSQKAAMQTFCPPRKAELPVAYRQKTSPSTITTKKKLFHASPSRHQKVLPSPVSTKKNNCQPKPSYAPNRLGKRNHESRLTDGNIPRPKSGSCEPSESKSTCENRTKKCNPVRSGDYRLYNTSTAVEKIKKIDRNVFRNGQAPTKPPFLAIRDAMETRNKKYSTLTYCQIRQLELNQMESARHTTRNM